MRLPLAAIEFFGQKAEPHDLVIVALLVVLEGVLSIDNALVLGLLAKRLPRPLQRRALTYGLVGALIFRMAAIGAAAWLLQWTVAKLLGGAYLIYVSLKHFFFEEPGETTPEVRSAWFDDSCRRAARPRPDSRRHRGRTPWGYRRAPNRRSGAAFASNRHLAYARRRRSISCRGARPERSHPGGASRRNHAPAIHQVGDRAAHPPPLTARAGHKGLLLKKAIDPS